MDTYLIFSNGPSLNYRPIKSIKYNKLRNITNNEININESNKSNNNIFFGWNYFFKFKYSKNISIYFLNFNWLFRNLANSKKKRFYIHFTFTKHRNSIKCEDKNKNIIKDNED